MTPQNSSETTSQLQRRELQRCLHCYKSRLALPEGEYLSKCAGCKSALYCSRKCQKASWPGHKMACKANQRVLSMPFVGAGEMKKLRTFTSKHLPTISKSGFHALDLCLDQTRASRDVFTIFVKHRPGSTKAETAFIVIDADVHPTDFFAEQQTETLRSQHEYYSDELKRSGMWGCFMVVLCDCETMASYVHPVGFGPAIMSIRPGQLWKEELIGRINGDTVY